MKDKIEYNLLNIILSLIFLIILVFNVVLITKTTFAVDNRLDELAPAEFEVTMIIDPNCDNCFNLVPFVDYFKEANVDVTEEDVVEYDSAEGKSLISKYDIKKIPAMIIKGEIDKNSEVKSLLDEIGEINDDTFVLTKIRPVYYDLESKEYKGLFKIIFLNDASCEECYDVSVHKNALENLALETGDQELIDVADDKGKELIEKYNIKYVPTIVLSGDLEEFENLQTIWESVGTVEEDGSYVFREGVNQLGKYRDLESGEILDPTNN